MGNHPLKLLLDTETCGLHSMMVLLQYAEEDGPIRLHEVWRRPIRETLRLVEWLTEQTVVGFNLSFDWFHICKVYTIFRLCDPDWIPEEHIDEIALLEPQAQDGPCVKPAAVLDLMLHSRKGPYQSLMAREDVRIKRVPTALAYALARELEGKVQFDNIYFAKSADPEAPKWQVFDRHDSFGELDTEFKDVVLKFNPAGGLKFLAEHALKLKPKYHYSDVEPSPAWRPYELGYAPVALAVSSPDKRWAIETDGEGDKRVTKYAWPGVIRMFIDHWATREDARELFTIVGHLESLAGSLTASFPPERREKLANDLAALNKELNQIATRQPIDPRGVFDLDEAFHLRLMDDSAGPRLRALYNSVRPQVERYWRLYASTIINELHHSVTEHNEIINAIRRGDPEAVEHTLQKNWINGLQRISGLIDVFGERGSW